MVDLTEHLHPSRVGDLRGTTKEQVLAEMVELVRSSEAVEDAKSLLAAVRERERVLSTGIGLGIAIPHAKIPGVSRFVVAVGRHKAGIDFDAIDGRPVHLVVLIAGPQDAQDRYLRLLARLSQRLKQEDVRKRILAAPGPSEIVTILEGPA
jgi:PTS system nitrogen regulatory IIA component